MADYAGVREVEADADSLFEFLSQVDNLPRYFPRITEARPSGDDAVDVTAVIAPPGEEEHAVRSEAWFRVDHDRRQVEWGAEGPNDYRGHLEVTDDGDSSRVRLTLHTQADHPGIQEGVEETLGTIAGLVEGR